MNVQICLFVIFMGISYAMWECSFGNAKMGPARNTEHKFCEKDPWDFFAFAMH